MDGVTMLFCVTYGAWATSKPLKLYRECTRRTIWGAECLRVIATGWTPVAPHLRRPIHGTWLIKDLREPLVLATSPPPAGEVEMTQEERVEAELQTWSREWTRNEQARLLVKATMLAEAALEPIGADSLPAPPNDS